MNEFALAYSTASDWSLAVAECVAALPPRDGHDNFGFLYATDHLAPHLNSIVLALREQTGITAWVGSIGIGICAGELEIFDAPGLAVMTGQFDEQDFRIFSGVREDAAECGEEVLAWCRAESPYLGVVHADPRNAGIAELIGQFAQRIGGGFLVGGLASSRRECPQLAREVVEGGLSGVLFSTRVGASTRLTQGCSPISERQIVSKAEGNLIYEIDGRPAVEALAAAAGELLMRNPRELGGRVFVGFPIAGTDTGDYLVRNLVGLDLDAGVVAVGERVEAGQPMLFCRRDADAAHEDLARMVSELKRSMSGPPRGAVYFSCLARGPNLFGPNSAELRQVQEALGGIPLVGFFANGEISHDRLYAYTGVLTVFS